MLAVLNKQQFKYVVTVSFILMLNRGNQCCNRDLLVKGIRLYRFEMIRKIRYLRFERSIDKTLKGSSESLNYIVHVQLCGPSTAKGCTGCR